MRKCRETMEKALILNILNIIGVHVHVQVITSPLFQGHTSRSLTVRVPLRVTVIPELRKCKNRIPRKSLQSTKESHAKPRYHFRGPLQHRKPAEVGGSHPAVPCCTRPGRVRHPRVHPPALDRPCHLSLPPLGSRPGSMPATTNRSCHPKRRHAMPGGGTMVILRRETGGGEETAVRQECPPDLRVLLREGREKCPGARDGPSGDV